MSTSPLSYWLHLHTWGGPCLSSDLNSTTVVILPPRWTIVLDAVSELTTVEKKRSIQHNLHELDILISIGSWSVNGRDES